MILVVPALSSALVLAGASPGAAAAGPAPAAAFRAVAPGSTHTIPGAPKAALAGPAGSVKDDALLNDSCTHSSNPADRYYCLATGWWVAPGFVHALSQSSTGGTWFGQYPLTPPPTKNTVVLTNEVSCATPDGSLPTCVAVGLHYSNPTFTVQYAEVGSLGSADIISINPPGTTWSQLNDVSCPTVGFCLLVGSAGPTRKTAQGTIYLSHATAYTYSQQKLKRLTVPVPPHARTTELAGLACASATSCMAVGNYTNASGTWLTYVARWTSGSWHVITTPNIKGERYTTFQGVACPSPAICMATGEAYRPGSRPFAELWRGGKWRLETMPVRSSAGFFSDSCPDVSDCVAVGWHGAAALIEAWNGSSWRVQRSPATTGAFSGDDLMHVSCVTATACAAVGLRYHPRVRRSADRTLAVAWDGHHWVLQQTLNF